MGIFGRAAELDFLDTQDSARKVLLCGPAGVGKSCLARHWLKGRPHRELSGGALATPAAFEAALAAALELPPTRSPRQGSRLGHALLAQGPLWVLLDGAEALQQDTFEAIDALLGQAPELRLLITSRRHLSAVGAVTLEVPPLCLPGTGKESSALALLLHRAREFRRAYQPKPGEADALERIVRRLDGLPLAIEVAAPRMVLLGAARFAERLENHPNALGKGDALRLALEASWQLLDASSQKALRECALFRGSFDIDAVEALVARCDSELGEVEELDAIDLLQTLYEHSWLCAVEDGRFEMYRQIRDFLVVHAPAPAESALRFSAYYARLGEDARVALEGSAPKEAWATLVREQPNLRQATRVGAIEDRLLALRALAPVALAQGPFDDFVALADQVASAADQGLPLAVQARLLQAEALAIAGQGDAALLILETQGEFATEPELRAEFHRVRAKIALTRGALEEAIACADRGLAEGLPQSGLLRMVRAAALGPLGRLDECRESLEGALAEFRRGHRFREQGIALAYLGNVFADLDRMSDARFCLAQAQAIHEEVGDRFGIAFSEANVGLVLHKEGNPKQALVHYEAAIPAFARLGARWYELGFSGYRAMALHQVHGATPEVATAFRDCLAEVEPRDRFFGYFTAYLATVVAEQGGIESARTLLEQAQGHIDASGDPVFALVLDWHRARILKATGQGDAEELRRLRKAAEESVLVDVCVACVKAEAGAESPVSSVSRGIVIASDGTSFSDEKGRLVELGDRPSLRRLLFALLEAHRQAPGQAVAHDALIEAGWQGERILPKAARNRLRVAIATLRKLGLQDAIRTRGSGYYLELGQ